MTKEDNGHCPVCRIGRLRQKTIAWLDKVGNPPAIVLNLPACVCDTRGTETVSSTVARELERLAVERPEPVRTTRVPIYDLTGTKLREAS